MERNGFVPNLMVQNKMAQLNLSASFTLDVNASCFATTDLEQRASG